MEDITDANNAHVKRVCKDFEIKNWGEYHDLYVQSNTLFLADVFDNFRNMYLIIYELDPAKYLSAPGLGKEFDSWIRSVNWHWYVKNGRKRN